jgi:hypothetical protein
MAGIVSTGTNIVRYGPDAFRRLVDLVSEVKTNDIFALVTVAVNVRFMDQFRVAEYLGSPRLVANGKSPFSPLLEMAAIRSVGSEMV